MAEVKVTKGMSRKVFVNGIEIPDVIDVAQVIEPDVADRAVITVFSEKFSSEDEEN